MTIFLTRMHARIPAVIAGVLVGGILGSVSAQIPEGPAATIPPFNAVFPPARYVAPGELADHVAKLFSILSMSHRDIDPFGRNQDPNFRPAQPEIARPDTVDPSEEVAKPALLSDLVSGIQVTVVMPTKQTFFVGDRAFHRGDRFPLRTVAGTLVNVEVLSVSSSSIIFREISKGETAVLRLGGAPAGVQRGTNLQTPPGVTLPNPAAPLDLQPAPVPSNSPR